MVEAFTRKVRVRGIIPFDNKYLFVVHAFDTSFMALPGGGLDDGETLQNGLERELVEELGVKPVIGKLLYVQQLFLKDGSESLEFFFHVENGADFQSIDLNATTHGAQELSEVLFIDPASARTERILPEFLTDLHEDIALANWPKVYVRHEGVV